METLTIIDAGPGWLVIDKPCDLSVHNEPGKDLISLVAQQIAQSPELAERISYQAWNTIGPVHRLDRETSGVILLGLTPEICRWFSRQFEERQVVKKYMAVVHGSFDQAVPCEQVWDRALSPEAGGRKDPEGKGKKVPCLTRIRVMTQSPHYALIECELMTGRKHQIRRHAKLAGHPVLGDARYGSKRAIDYIKTHCQFTRLALHSLALEVILPGIQESKTFTSHIPNEFMDILKKDMDGGTIG